MEDTILYALLAVFFIAAFPLLEIWLAIPAGLALGLDPYTTAAVAFIGNALPVALIILFFDRIRIWIDNRSSREPKEPGRARRRFDALWNRYGLPAVALTAPVTVGTHMVAFIVMAAGSKAWEATAWMLFGLLVWTVLFTVSFTLGLSLFT